MRWGALRNKRSPVDLRAVIFDMDGTILDVPYDWPRIKKDLQTGGQPILHHISQLSEPERTKKWRILESYEERATARAVLMEGVPDLLGFLRRRKIRTALVTNNSRHNVNELLNRFKLEFDLISTRENGLWKPSGEPFIDAMRRLGVSRRECCTIGDSIFDLLAARAAGIDCVFMVSAEPDNFKESGAVICRNIPEVHSRLTEKMQADLP